MHQPPRALLANWRYDLPASLVVFLVALPLCLGIALASGAPLFSGLIAGMVGGIVVGALSKSPLSVSGPAAGLTVIVLAAIQSLPSYESFLLAVCLAGAMQIIFGVVRAGVIADFIPSSVITGMLSAIGLILIMKQLPHAIGYHGDFFGDENFLQHDGENTMSAIYQIFGRFLPGACLIAATSLAFLFWWDKKQPKFTGWLRYIPGPLLVVIFGVVANAFFSRFIPEWTLAGQHLVSVPVSHSLQEFVGNFKTPDFSALNNPNVWGIAITLALVASIESLLSIEAIDKLDTFKRVTPTNRELWAQGAGNLVSGLIGGLPVTSVIVRSSANVSSGARSKLSAISHGILILLCVVAIPGVLNLLPLSALSAVLIAVGYKLTKPSIVIAKYKKGLSHFIPFAVTAVAILLTDLLVGITIGVCVGTLFVLVQNFRSAILFLKDDDNYLIRFKKDLFFIHKYELKKTLNSLPDDCSVLIDLTRIHFIDKDNIEILNDFTVNAHYRGITVVLRHNEKMHTTTLLESKTYAAA